MPHRNPTRTAQVRHAPQTPLVPLGHFLKQKLLEVHMKVPAPMRGLNHRQDAFVRGHPVSGFARQVNELTRNLPFLTVFCDSHQRHGVLQDLRNPLGVPHLGTALGIKRRIEPVDHGSRFGNLCLGHA